MHYIPSFEIFAEVSKYSDMQSNEVDLNMYYQVEICNLNIFHTNINGLETKMENLHKFLTSTS